METQAADAIALTSAGERYTNVPIIPSTIVALAGGSLTVILAYLVRDTIPSVYTLIMERGPVQFLTVYAFWFTLGMLALKFRGLQRERAAFTLSYINSFTAGRETVGTKTILAHADRIEENLDPTEKDLLLINRINKGIKQVRLGNTPAEVANVLSRVADIDDSIIDSSYALIKFMIWAIPILGFIGTIMGMTQAIGSFDTVLKGIDEVGFTGVQENLGLVTGGLAVAFQTTFLALILSVVLNLLANALQKKEEDFLSDVEDFTTENMVNKLSQLKASLSPLSPTAPVPVAIPGQQLDLERGVQDLVAQLANLRGEQGVVETVQAVFQELRNMNKQNQVNNDELLSQIGRLVEAMGSTRASTDDPEAQGLRELLQVHADGRQRMDQATQAIARAMAAIEQLQPAIAEIAATNRKLGEIYDRLSQKVSSE